LLPVIGLDVITMRDDGTSLSELFRIFLRSFESEYPVPAGYAVMWAELLSATAALAGGLALSVTALAVRRKKGLLMIISGSLSFAGMLLLRLFLTAFLQRRYVFVFPNDGLTVSMIGSGSLILILCATAAFILGIAGFASEIRD